MPYQLGDVLAVIGCSAKQEHLWVLFATNQDRIILAEQMGSDTLCSCGLDMWPSGSDFSQFFVRNWCSIQGAVVWSFQVV